MACASDNERKKEIESMLHLYTIVNAWVCATEISISNHLNAYPNTHAHAHTADGYMVRTLDTGRLTH